MAKMFLMCGFTEMFWAHRRIFNNSSLLPSLSDPKKNCWFSNNYAFFKSTPNFLKENVRSTRKIDIKKVGKIRKSRQNMGCTHTNDTKMEGSYRKVEKLQKCRPRWWWVEDQICILLEACGSTCNRLNWDMKECYFQDNFAIFRHSTYPLPNMDKCFRATSENQMKNRALSITNKGTVSKTKQGDRELNSSHQQKFTCSYTYD